MDKEQELLKIIFKTLSAYVKEMIQFSVTGATEISDGKRDRRNKD